MKKCCKILFKIYLKFLKRNLKIESEIVSAIASVLVCTVKFVWIHLLSVRVRLT